MKKIHKKISLIISMILVINSCNTLCFSEDENINVPASELAITNVNLDTGSAASVSEEGIVTSKTLPILVETTSSAGDVQTVTLYKKNGEDKEAVCTVNVTPDYRSWPSFTYFGRATLFIEAAENTNSEGEYCIGVKSASHVSEEYMDVKSSSWGREVSKIIVDTIMPSGTDCSVKEESWMEWIWEKSSTQINGVFSDEHSGIKKIEYCVDNGWKQEYQLNGENIHKPGEKIAFSLKLDGKGKFVRIFVTDNAGNEYQCASDAFARVGADNIAPEIKSIIFEPYIEPKEEDEADEVAEEEAEKESSDEETTEESTEETTTDEDEELKFEDISKILYDKICIVDAPFSIKVDASDVAPENVVPVGIDTVELCDGENVIGQFELVDNLYVYTVKETISADELTIRVKDKSGFTTTKKVSEIDKERKDSYYMETVLPTAEADYKNSVQNSGQYWYNNNGGDFIIKIEDKESGIKSIVINDNVDDETEEYASVKFTEQIKTYEQVIDTSKLSDGEHVFTAVVYDNCGNKTEEEYNYIIHIDHGAPSITYKIKNSNGLVIDDKSWYDINDELVVVASIEKSSSLVGKVEFKINNRDYRCTDSLEEINENLKVELKIPVRDYFFGNETAIEIVGYVESTSGNSNSSQDKLTCNVDRMDPEIKSITINKIEEPSYSSKLNLVYSGIYTNNSVKFSVEAVDAEGDSGIDHVDFSYVKDGEKIVNNMTLENNKYVYTLSFAESSNLFESEFEIVAYDKCGKISKYSPAITDNEGNFTNKKFIMQENIIPEVNIDLPVSDGVERIDNQTWYKDNKNISVNLKDVQSGIRYVKIFVNDVEIKEDINGQKILDLDTSKVLEENKTSLKYDFSTDFFEKTIGESEDGRYAIKVEVCDNAGNICFDNTKSYNIDKTNPNVDKVVFSRKTADGYLSTNEFVSGLKYGYYFDKEFAVKINTSDENASSGLDHINYRLVTYNKVKKEVPKKDKDKKDDDKKNTKKDNGKEETEIIEVTEKKTVESGMVQIINGNARISIPNEFKGQIYVKAVDQVGNESKQVTTLAYVEDETAPEIKISPLKDTRFKDNEGNKLYAKKVAFNVSIKDLKSGLKTVEYYVEAENNKVEKNVLKLENEGYKVGDKLENGWVVTKMDENLVVEVSQRFVFKSDDNDVMAFFKASDRSGNETKYNKTEKFSIDKTTPVIKINFTEGVKSDPKYYNASKKALMTISVEERNFDEKLMDISIKDSYKNNTITPKFVKGNGAYNYVATIDYPEGDYDVSISGKDIVEHYAEIYVNGNNKSQQYFSTDFMVDTTSPNVTTNFASFNNTTKKGNYFNKKKTATITVREHNFSSELMNLNVWEKESGQGQNLKGSEKNSYALYSRDGWSDDGDIHSINLKFDKDGIYKVELKPSDLAENAGSGDSTTIFEIDTTAPEVSMVNGEEVEENQNTNCIDVYDENRKDEAAPSVEYFDKNFDSIKYEIVRYVPEYENDKEFSKVTPEFENKTIGKKEFKLGGFDKDGIYAVEMIAYDKAGNASKLNKNTYVRMVDKDVLAYIENSHPGNSGEIGTGWYSIEDEDGPLSKRPDNFEDLDITVLAKNDANISITLNSNDGDVTDTGVECSSKEEVYGAGAYRYVLSKNYFKDHYQEDTDATFYLTVNDSDDRIELGQIHIDNIAPECELPSYFHNWGWIRGNDAKSIEISDISEKIDINKSCVYVDGKKVDYTYRSDENKLVFPIEDGNHRVGISIVDFAGNELNVPEISHLEVGNTRVYFGIGALVLLIAGSFGLIVFRRRKRAGIIE